MKNQQRAFCSFCQLERTFERRSLDHYFHGVVTILTVGLWAVGWCILFLRQARKPLRCRCCRHRLRKAGEIQGLSDYAALYTALDHGKPEAPHEAQAGAAEEARSR